MARSSEIFGAVVVIGLMAGPVAAQTKPAVTLAEAVERSERVQPRIVQAAGVVRNADARVRSSKGAYLPNLNVSSSAAELYREGQGVVAVSIENVNLRPGDSTAVYVIRQGSTR